MGADATLVEGARAIAQARTKKVTGRIQAMGKAGKTVVDTIAEIKAAQEERKENTKKQQEKDKADLRKTNSSKAMTIGMANKADSEHYKAIMEANVAQGNESISDGTWGETGFDNFQTEDMKIQAKVLNANQLEASIANAGAIIEMSGEQGQPVLSNTIDTMDPKYELGHAIANSEYVWGPDPDGDSKNKLDYVRIVNGEAYSDEEIEEALSYISQTKDDEALTTYTNNIQRGFANADDEFDTQSVINNALEQHNTVAKLENILTNVYDDYSGRGPLDINSLRDLKFGEDGVKGTDDDLKTEDDYRDKLKEIYRGELEIDKANHYNPPVPDDPSNLEVAVDRDAEIILSQFSDPSEKGIMNFLTEQFGFNATKYNDEISKLEKGATFKGGSQGIIVNWEKGEKKVQLPTGVTAVLDEKGEPEVEQDEETGAWFKKMKADYTTYDLTDPSSLWDMMQQVIGGNKNRDARWRNAMLEKGRAYYYNAINAGN